MVKTEPSDSHRNKVKKVGLEVVRLIVVLLVGIYVAFPFLATSPLQHTLDLQVYILMMGDFLAQIRQGMSFPLITQSSYFPFANPSPARAPVILFFGAIFDFFTGRHQSPSFILNLVTAFVLCINAALSYFSLVWVDSKRRWEAALFACIYSLAPVSISLLYCMDMYWTCVTYPFVFIAICAAYRLRVKGDFQSSIVLAGALTFVFAGHPVVGLALGAFIGVLFLFYGLLVSNKRKFFSSLASVSITFVLLSAGYFARIFQIGAGNNGDKGTELFLSSETIKGIYSYLSYSQKTLINAFAPGTGYNLALGYSVWALLILSVLVIWKKKDKMLAIQVVCTILLIALFIPIPYLTPAVMHCCPRFLMITLNVQRLGTIATSSAILCGFLSFRLVGARWSRFGLAFLLLALIWTAYDTHSEIFGKIRLRLNPQYRSGMKHLEEIDKRAENMSPYAQSLWKPFPKAEFFEPIFENRLLHLDETVLIENREILSRRCEERSLLGVSKPIRIDKSEYGSVIEGKGPTLFIEPYQHYVFGFQNHSINAGFSTVITGPTFNREYSGESKNLVKGERNLISLWQSGFLPEALKINAAGFIRDRDAPSIVELRDFCLLRYDPLGEDLPIHVQSILPYRVRVHDLHEQALLETHLAYWKNYKVRINGKQVPYFESKRTFVAVPVGVGDSLVEIEMVPTVSTALAEIVSLIAWVFCLIFLFCPNFILFLTKRY